MHVGDFQTQSGRRIHAKHSQRIVQMNERERRIVFVVTGLEYSDNLERLQAWQHARRRHLPLRRCERHLVARLHLQCARQFAAKNDIELTRLQCIEATAPDLGRDIRHLRFFLRQHTADNCTAHVFVVQQHRLRHDVRRGASHFLMLKRLSGDLLPVRQGAIGAKHFDMCEHR